MSNNAHELSNRLLNALDNSYNVVDMQAVNEIISILEKFNITKELLETTRLGKHVNELRRKTKDPTLARRAKVLVKRWRDLVIPAVASPAHIGSNRSSSERSIRRLGGTPITSPAISRQVVSPAINVNILRPPSKPAWGYESDSDVIVVDDEPPPPPAPAAHPPLTPPVRRSTSPTLPQDEKKAKRDKKPKKKRAHGRAGAGSEAATAWGGRNGHERRNGRSELSYAALVTRLPPAGAKKVKTTKELLEEIQSRGSKPLASPSPPRSPASPDVMFIEPDDSTKEASPIRNGRATPAGATLAGATPAGASLAGATPAGATPAASPPRAPSPAAVWDPPEEEEEIVCTCTGSPGAGSGGAGCPAAARPARPPLRALHAALLPGVNGTRAPPARPHPARPATAEPGLFASVVPLYRYTDYTDDYCVKNLDAVRLGDHSDEDASFEIADVEMTDVKVYPELPERLDVEEMRVKSDIELDLNESKECNDEAQLRVKPEPMDVEPNTRPNSPLCGASLRRSCAAALGACRVTYAQAGAAPELSLPVRPGALAALRAPTARDELGRPRPATTFAEWHECARLGDLLALPYVVID